MAVIEIRNVWNCICKENVDTPSIEDYMAACGYKQGEYEVKGDRVLDWSDSDLLPKLYEVEVAIEPDAKVLDTAADFMWSMWLMKHRDYKITKYGSSCFYTVEERRQNDAYLAKVLEQLRVTCMSKERLESALDVLCVESWEEPILAACIAFVLNVPVDRALDIIYREGFGSSVPQDCEDEVEAYIYLYKQLLNNCLEREAVSNQWKRIAIGFISKLAERNAGCDEIIRYSCNLQQTYRMVSDGYVLGRNLKDEQSDFLKEHLDDWYFSGTPMAAIYEACCEVYSAYNYTGLLATCYAIGLPKLDGHEVPVGTRTMVDIDKGMLNGIYGLSGTSYDFTRVVYIPVSSLRECKTMESLIELVEKYCKIKEESKMDVIESSKECKPKSSTMIDMIKNCQR